MDKGYLYFCGGSAGYLRDAIRSAHTVRKWDPEAQICLIHSYAQSILDAAEISVFDRVQRVELGDDLPDRFAGGAVHFLAKIQALAQSPYEATLFLDSDTWVLGNLANLFALTERFDIGVAAAPITQRAENDADPLHDIPDTFPEPNTGVILWRRNERMTRFLERWISEYRSNDTGLFRRHRRGGEQVALRYLLWNSPEIRLHFLTSGEVPNLYNFRWQPEKKFLFRNRIKVLHQRTAFAGLDASPAARAIPNGHPAKNRAGKSRPAIPTYEAAMAAFNAHCEAKGDQFYFIQIGANDGRTYDPIWKRIRTYRWKGILVEPVGHLYERLRKLHAGSAGLVFENLAIASFDGVTPFHYFPEEMERDPEFPAWAAGMGSILGQFESPGHEAVAERGFRMTKTEVPCLKLESLCQRHNVTGVDLLQIDAEGFDAEILCGTNFSSFRPRFIQYEDRHIQRLFDQGKSRWAPPDVRAHLEKAGYQTVPVGNGFDQFCLRTDEKPLAPRP